MAKSKQVFELSEEDVKTAISEFLVRRHGDGKPIAVHVGAEMEWRGYGPGEHQVPVVKITAEREC